MTSISKRFLILAATLALASCARTFVYKPFVGGLSLPRSEVAAVSLNSARVGQYNIALAGIDGESPPESYVDYYVAHHVSPGPHTIRVMFYAAIPGESRRYLAATEPITIHAVLQKGRSYIFVADLDRGRGKVAVRIVDVGGPEVPDECLLLNHPSPPNTCFQYPWFQR